MIDPAELFETLQANGVNFYSGIPDSVLKEFCNYVLDNTNRDNLPTHLMAVNEGGAVSLAAGFFLATGDLGVVYLQNSGLGNAINPLASLAAPEAFGIPMILVIGWRGEPNVHDEPQHILQGRSTTGFLELLNIPYRILDASSDVQEAVEALARSARSHMTPTALVVRRETFGRYEPESNVKNTCPMTREEALRNVYKSIPASAVLISSAGKMSREFLECYKFDAQSCRSFLPVVGSMGHASQIALGIATARARRRVYCVEGDGSALMHMGGFALIGSKSPANFVHIVVNNGVHDSVGGQPTPVGKLSFVTIATACGYQKTLSAQTVSELSDAMKDLAGARGPCLLEIMVQSGARANIRRPDVPLTEHRKNFMDSLERK